MPEYSRDRESYFYSVPIFPDLATIQRRINEISGITDINTGGLTMPTREQAVPHPLRSNGAPVTLPVTVINTPIVPTILSGSIRGTHQLEKFSSAGCSFKSTRSRFIAKCDECGRAIDIENRAVLKQEEFCETCHDTHGRISVRFTCPECGLRSSLQIMAW